MKSLKEALVHKHMDRYQSFIKQDLKPGYIVKLRNGELRMFYEYTGELNNMNKKLKLDNGRLAVIESHNGNLRWDFLGKWDEKLRFRDKHREMDVIEVYPSSYVSELGTLVSSDLEYIIKNINPIKIN